MVDNSRAAMRSLARAARSRFAGECFAVTGSVGKTTVKEMIGTVLSACIPTVVARGNLNLENGILATLASTPSIAGAVIVEVSTIMPGAIRKRAREVRPTVGIVTNVGVSHGGRFEHPGELVAEKLSLLDCVQPGGVAVVGESVLDRDEQGLIARKNNIDRVLVVGASPRCDVRLLETSVSAASTTALIEIEGRKCSVFIPLAGAHFADAAAFALASAHLLGADMDTAGAALASHQANRRRSTRWSVALGGGKQVELIDDSYNAAPVSVSALLDSVAVRNGARRRVLVLGDMLELGGDAAQHHVDLRDKIEASGIDVLLTVGALAALAGKGLPKAVKHIAFENSTEVAAAIPGLLQDGDLVAVKGSNGVKLDKVSQVLVGKGRGASVSPFWTIEQARPR